MRWIVRLMGVAVSLVVLAALALFLLPAERIANLAAGQFQQATGRALTIGGSVRPTVWPNLGARVEGVSIASADWAQAGPLLSAEVLDLSVDLAGLIGGDIRVRRFEARGARIVLERDADGRANWQFEGLAATAPAGPAEGSAPGALSLDVVEIRNASIRIIDRAAGLDLMFDGIDADLSLPDLAGPGTLAISGTRGGQALAADIRIAQVQRFLAGEVTGLNLSARVGEARLGFEGRAGLATMAVDGRLTVQAAALAPVLAALGQPGPEPLPAAARPLDFAGQVTVAPAGSLHLREGQIGLGATRLQAALDLTFDGPRPRLAGSVSAGALDLRPFLGGGAAAPAQSGWPRDRIDADALGLIDAQVSLAAGPVQTGMLDLDRLNAVLTIDRARAVLDLREARAFGGNLTGELVANNRSGLSVGGNIRAADMQLLPLLRQMAGFERLSGSGTLALRFLGSGQSVDAIIRSLSGEGRLDLGRGEIIGLDLAGMIRTLDMSYMGEQNRTVYDSIAGSFAIQNGVLTNQDLRLTARLLDVEGRGRVDLGGQTLDYRVTPVAMRNAETGQALRVPLVITGPWGAPRFRLDLEGLAEQRLQEERARLEARAREELERREQQARQELARREAELRARAEQELQQRLRSAVPEGSSTSTRGAVEETLRQEVGGALDRLLRRSN
jgi:AsmA protein